MQPPSKSCAKKRSSTEDKAEKASRFVEIAKLFETRLNNNEHAAVAFHQAFLLSPSNLEAMENAIRLYREVGEWQRVIAVLRTRLESVNEGTEKARLLFQIGDIFLNHLEEGRSPEGQQKASQLFKEALSLDPELQEAQEALDDLAYELEDWSSLLKRLKKEIRRSSDSPERAAFLNYKIAEGYYRREGKPAYAIRYCKQALELQSNYEKALDLLQKLYAELGKWEALADFLSEQAKQSGSSEGQVRWWKKLSELYRVQTQERDREIDTLERILEISPSEQDTLQRLEEIYREDSRYSSALGVMEKRLATLHDLGEKKALLSTMATLAFDELRRPEQAAGYYEEILDIDADDIEAIDALLPLYESEGQWEKLISGYERKLQYTEEKTDRAQIYTRVGDIYGNQLRLSKEAFDSYTYALRENPQDFRAYREARILGSPDRQLARDDLALPQYPGPSGRPLGPSGSLLPHRGYVRARTQRPQPRTPILRRSSGTSSLS